MHPLFTNPSNVPAFLIKLWKLVEDSSTDDLVTWNYIGSSFIITDVDKFAKELLPQYFKHNNIASFIRQLNIYGFRKVMNYTKASDAKEVEFQHAFFLRDKAELLENIKRKIASPKTIEPDASLTPKDILTNLSTIREKQRNMDTTLTNMKKENEVLWRELSTVRQRHKAQEQLLHKVIQFLVQIIQRSNQSIHVPRKLARMLHDSSVSQEQCSQLARIVDVLRNKDSDHIIVPDEPATNPLSAVIHEVTDFDPEVVTSGQPLLAKNKSSLHSTSTNKETGSSPGKLHNRATSPATETSFREKNSCQSMRYVAVPVHGDPNKLVLIPADNFKSKEISTLTDDSFCKIIALPEKEPEDSDMSITNNASIPMEDISHNFSKHKLKKSNIQFDAPEGTCLNSSQSDISAGISSKRVPEGFSIWNSDFNDSVLSDLLQASKISTIDDDCENFPPEENCVSKLQESFMESDVEEESSTPNFNNQVAIPGPSSLVKSTKNCFPDFSNLQDSTTTIPSSFDVKILEQLFSSDDATSTESFMNQSPSDVNMSNPSDDIVGNELVQFIPAVLEEGDDIQWLDFLDQESHAPSGDLNNDFYCGPRDTDVLIESNHSRFASSIEALKKEAILTTPKRNSYKNSKTNKRRKGK